jgi:hypothetical protein
MARRITNGPVRVHRLLRVAPLLDLPDAIVSGAVQNVGEIAPVNRIEEPLRITVL